MSRMLGVILEDNVFDPSTHPSIREYIERIRIGSDLLEAVVLFDKEVAKYLHEQKYMYGFVSEEEQGACIRMKFLTSSFAYFGRWLLTYTDRVRVESPEVLKTHVRELGEKLSTHHGSY
jgi:predicted DNA-binding transcriptional regulator YafY